MNTTQTNLKFQHLDDVHHVVTGVAFYGELHHASTRVDSKSFRTERGAIAWLARRGYNANGTRTA